ncbi:hypothetical protein Nepgr_007516 [Nepenthes gracilis]|uniref:cyclin-dependent kinase n=1 Tax=Nepenthes gracilis TaxID=150966 RepID=A0AAD3S7U5_NEPGR|nr:hypothetical protein Nepgr_007516 [Nepenthes gracilis]
MDRYKMIKEVGDGTFGNVWKAINKQTGEVVAIKKMKKKYCSWEECINLREVKSLRKLNHTNIVKLKEVIREHDILHFVFEYMECNLYQLMKERGKPFSEIEVRSWCFQVFQGLAYMHHRGYFHRDLKPENLLVTKDIIKIADFGLAREITSGPPYTEYVSTRWYRAPEVLLQSPTYTSAVDMWAMGAVIAEMFSLRPLFPGLSEVDEIYKICCVIGSPTEDSWAYGLLLARAMKYQFPQLPGVHLPSLIPSASKDAISLITSLCAWDPCKRPTAAEVLHHPFFQNYFYVPPLLRPGASVSRTPPTGSRGFPEQKSSRNHLASAALSDPKPANNARTLSGLSAGVQGKVEMDGQDSIKNDKILKSFAKPPPKYCPPARNSPTSIYAARSTRRLSDTVKLSSMAVSSGRQPTKQSLPPPMKAGGWHAPPNLHLGRSRNIQPGGDYMRKVAG